MDTLANRNNNPGNLRFIGQNGASQGEGGFARFDSPASGYAALLNDLDAKLSGNSRSGLTPDHTLADMVNVYAPSKDNNNPANYTAVVANKLGVSPGTKLSELKPRLGELAEAMAQHEGYKGQSSYKGGYNPTPFSNPTQGSALGQNIAPPTPTQSTVTTGEQGLGQQLLGRTNQTAEAIKKGISGEINPLSSILQTGGAIAGGLGDVVNAGIGAIGKGIGAVTGFDPVQKVEELVGQGVGALANSSFGKPIIDSITSWAKEHPELSGDIGAGFNIVTAIPILRGLGAAKNLALDGTANAFKEMAEKGIAKDFAGYLGTTAKGRSLLQATPDLAKLAVAERALPEVINVGGKSILSTDNAVDILNSKIKQLAEKELQPILNDITSRQNFGQQLSNLKNIAIREIESDPRLMQAGVVPDAIKFVERKFDGWAHSYGDNAKLDIVNVMKKGAGDFTDFNTPEASAGKAIYRALKQNIEEIATANGYPGVSQINKQMGDLINLRDVYKAKGVINNRTLGAATGKNGLAQSLVRSVPGGETAMKIKDYASPGGLLKSLQGEVIKRTTPGYTKIKGKTALKKIGGLVGAAEAQKSLK